jgi:Type II secretion system (T2SS), protein E, N-terminal domain
MFFLDPFTWTSKWIARHYLASESASCASLSCTGSKTLWRRLRSQRTGTILDGKFYCRPQCLETALVARISRLREMTQPVQPPNRIPLGLLMVARGKLTHFELRAALEAQRRARYDRIGDWFEKLGFATEQDVTAALALQWGCPLVSSFELAVVDLPGSIPLPILEAFQMLPANYVAATNTLYLAFGERVDHAALYAIERTLGCRTQPCVAGRKRVARQLESFRQSSRSAGVEFVTRDLSEMARITSSYVSRLGPQEVRLSRLGHFIWLRLQVRSAATNLVFNLQSNYSPSRVPSFASSSLAVAALTSPSRSAPDEPGISMGE